MSSDMAHVPGLNGSVLGEHDGVTVVAFDFDHTLTVGDSVVPFVIRVAGIGRVLTALVRTLWTVVGLVVRRDNDGLKAHFARQCLAGIDADRAATIGIEHAERIVGSRMRRDTASRLRAHQQRGDVVVIVSASFGEYMHVVGDLLEVDAVLCTELEQADGVLTGELSGPNCRGAEKVTRIRHWMAEAGLGGGIDVAYGDSSGDAAMLAAATRGVLVKHEELHGLIDTEVASRDGRDESMGAS